MSVVGGGDIPKPSSPHAGIILGDFWPGSSESAWESFAAALQAEGMRLFNEAEGPQKEIYVLVANDQAGPFIDAAIGVIQRRIATLENRWKAYQKASTATNLDLSPNSV